MFSIEELKGHQKGRGEMKSSLVERYKEAKKKAQKLQKEYFNAPDFEREWRKKDYEAARAEARIIWSRICKGER